MRITPILADEMSYLFYYTPLLNVNVALGFGAFLVLLLSLKNSLAIKNFLGVVDLLTFFSK